MSYQRVSTSKCDDCGRSAEKVKRYELYGRIRRLCEQCAKGAEHCLVMPKRKVVYGQPK